MRAFPDGLLVSAAARTGLDALSQKIEEYLQYAMIAVKVKLPYRDAELVALFHKHGSVEWEEYTDEGTTIKGYLPERLLDSFQDYLLRIT